MGYRTIPGGAIRIGIITGLLTLFLCLAFGQSDAPAAPKGPWMDTSLSPDQRADLVIEQMTLDEKIGMVHGRGMSYIDLGQPPDPALARSNGGAGFVTGVPRLGIPDLNLADSATGVARAAAAGRYSTPMPSTLAEAASWDLKLAYEYGTIVGRELRAQGYNVSLGGGVNLTREPRNGRTFEYQGEDPILAGKMVGQLVKGVQDQGVVGDIKHFALNDHETGRHVGDVRMDERTMRETDLLAFEIGLKDSGAGLVMCSYNRVNGDYACENSYLLNDVLKNAWGFKGWVVSDWFATYSTAKSALAGLDQEQPGSAHFGDALKSAVQKDEVPVARLDDMVHRILRTMFAVGVIDNPPVPAVVDAVAGLEMAQRVSEEGSVLLKNANGLLPLNADTVKSIAVIGSHADVGVLSGGGSGQVDPPGGNAVTEPLPEMDRAETEGSAIFGGIWVWHRSSPLRAIRAKVQAATVEYNDGKDPASAAALAKKSEIAIVFVNQPTFEGRDASDLSLPFDQDKLVSAVVAANPRTVVVLETGGPVSMPWIDDVGAVLEAWYPGIRGGEAIANILFGEVNPSAKLPVTFPKSVADLPNPTIMGPPPGAMSSPTAGLGGGLGPQVPPFEINYKGGLKIGYKWFDAESKEPLFAFGHGLSYTTFEYSGLKANLEEVTFTLRNTGKRAGAEVTQVYVGLPASTNEPPRRLVAWEKVQLAPGESKTVTLRLEPLHLSVFNVQKHDWEIASGDYTVFVGGSSRDTPLIGTVRRP